MVSTLVPEVLIADDESICCDILQLYLENFGCRVHVVSDGNEALAVFQDRADRIGLVILDARMPGPPPVELHKRIRKIRPCAPVLFCSGVSPEDPLIHAINDYGLRLLPKPFNRSELFDAILNVLKHSDAGVPAPCPA